MSNYNPNRRSFKDLIIWQKSMLLVKEVYLITEEFPSKEIYGLTSQIRRSAISIPSNIAEGYYRISQKEFRKFLRIAYGSAAEIETQFEIAKLLGYSKESKLIDLVNKITEVQKMLNTFTLNMKI